MTKHYFINSLIRHTGCGVVLHIFPPAKNGNDEFKWKPRGEPDAVMHF